MRVPTHLHVAATASSQCHRVPVWQPFVHGTLALWGRVWRVNDFA